MVFSSDYNGLYFVRQRIILINEFWHIIIQIIVRVEITPHYAKTANCFKSRE